MEKRQLGNSGVEIASLVLGTNVFGWTVDEPTAFRLLDAFVDAGGNCLDTADVYSFWAPGGKGGEAETIIGNWMRRRANRGKIVLISKGGNKFGKGFDVTKGYMLDAVESSLKRLQTDYIDIYLSHRDDTVTPPENTLEAYAELIAAGKIKIVGASNYTPGRIAESLAASDRKGYPRYQVLQPPYNLFDRSVFEDQMETLARKENMGVVTYYALASGFLTGKYESEADLAGRARGNDIKKYLNERGFKIMGALRTVASKHGTTAAQIAIAWLLAKPIVTAPIASATNEQQLQSLIAATDIKLGENELTLLDEAGR